MTGREAYNRIKWDDRIDAGRVKVGYQDRFRGVLEIDFHDRKLTHDVPWHRIVHFRYGDQVIWDREGTDLFDSLAQNSELKAAFCFAFHHGGWESLQAGCRQLAARPLRLASLNVLFDLYDDRVPSTESRLAGLETLLKQTDADIIALQEVTPKLCAMLSELGWVRQEFYMSQPPSGPDLAPYGPLLLSRLPGVFEHLKLATGKSVVQARFDFQGAPVQLFVVHLFSDRTDDAAARRREQLSELSSYFESGHSVWVVGDFNTRGLLELTGFQDAWLNHQAHDWGLTFDPAVNELARLTSNRARSGRLDRILTAGSWTVTDFEVVEDSGLVSDHHLIHIQLIPPFEEVPSHRSALVVIPPESVWEPIQSIRKQFDKSYRRWMPHINLVYGFIPEESFSAVRDCLMARLGNLRPFKVRLREFRRFEHAQSTTVWLQPETDPPDVLQAIHSICRIVFPACDEQSTHGEQGFTPHLTVANHPKSGPKPQLEPVDVEFEVSQIHLISRHEEQPFEVRETVCFRGEEAQEIVTVSQSVQQALDDLGSLLPGQVFPVGSTGLGLHLPWSDLDCLYVGSESIEELQKKLSRSRRVPGRVELLHCFAGELDIDLQFARVAQSMVSRSPDEWSTEERESLDSKASRALQAWSEIQAIQAPVEMTGFRVFLRQVRRWTHFRRLDSPALGFPGGLAWAILALQPYRNCGGNLDSAWKLFLNLISEWPWPDPYCLNGATYQTRERDRFPVVTLTSPHLNTSPQVIALTREILLREVRRALEMVQRNRWNTLCESPATIDEMFLTFEVPEHLESEECLGWLKANVVGFLLAAEKEVPFFRPLELGAVSHECHFKIDCPYSRPENSTVAFLKSYKDWASG